MRRPMPEAAIGDRFGRLIVTAVGLRKHGHRACAVRCDCGVDSVTRLQALRAGRAKSCGCVNPQRGKARTHGFGKHPSYVRWYHMMLRCYSPRNKGFDRYGGRGIAVCARWQQVAHFTADVGAPPSPGHTIDRINNDGGYWCGRPECPECAAAGRPCNVRWATRSEQERNKRSTIWVRIGDEMRPAPEVYVAHNVSAVTFSARVKRGWTPERAATAPPCRNPRKNATPTNATRFAAGQEITR